MRTCVCMHRDFMQTIRMNVCCLLLTAGITIGNTTGVAAAAAAYLLCVYYLAQWIECRRPHFFSFCFFVCVSVSTEPSECDMYSSCIRGRPACMQMMMGIAMKVTNERKHSSEIPKIFECVREHCNDVINIITTTWFGAQSQCRGHANNNRHSSNVYGNFVHRGTRFTIHVWNKWMDAWMK